MVGGEKPGPASHQPPTYEAGPAGPPGGGGRDREQRVAGVVSSVVMWSWPGEEAPIKLSQEARITLRCHGHEAAGCVVCCVLWHRNSCYVIMNYWKQIYSSGLCFLVRYILSLCINARQLNSILQNIITISDTEIGGQNRSRRIVRSEQTKDCQ